MPPNYRQIQGHQISQAERKGAVYLVAVVLAAVVGLGGWELTQGLGTQSHQKCVSVPVPGPTGGTYLRQCGAKAGPWCRTEAGGKTALAAQIANACRKEGYLPAAKH